MEVKVEVNECKQEKDYFPAIFANKDNSIIILADERTSQTTFSGMIISSTNKSKGCSVGVYGTGWTYQQFKRLPKHSTIKLEITQND